MKMEKLCNYSVWSLLFAVFIFGQLLCPAAGSAGGSPGLIAAKESRRRLVYTDAGEITTVDVSNGRKDGGSYHLEFFTLDTGSLFLPVLLHADMIFYVHTGRGNVSWIDKKRVKVVDVEEGDIYRLEEGTVFYIQSSDDPNRIKLRIHAIFNTWDYQETLADSFTGRAYSSIADLVRGFDAEVLRSAFGANADVIKEITKGEKVPPIIPFGMNVTESNPMDWREGIFEAIAGRTTLDYVFRNKKNDEKAFSIIKEKPDVENCHGRSTAVTHKEAKSLKGSSMGVFMVNLTEGSMIGPHWNPRATEIAIVVKGHGMVQVAIPTDASGVLAEDYKSSTKRFYVKEGDVFVVPRFHPMAQMSFQNSSFVFIGFSNNAKRNHPQFLVGKWSVLRTMKKEIMAAAFNIESSVLDELLSKQNDGVLLGCDGCAEEVERKMDVEIKREEEEKRREEEEEKREKEEAKRREEEAKRREEEEEQRKKEKEEEARKREEEEEHRRKEEEEEAKEREEEEEQRKKKEEEEARKREEEEEQGRKEEEEAQKREEEEEQRRKEEEEQRKKWEEEEARKREEDERREEEERRREEEEVAKKREEKMREEEEKQRREEEQEEVERRKEEKQRHKEMEEEARRREEGEEIRREEEKMRREEEAEEAEAQRRWEEEERREREGGVEEDEETSWEEGGGRMKWKRVWMI